MLQCRQQEEAPHRRRCLHPLRKLPWPQLTNFHPSRVQPLSPPQPGSVLRQQQYTHVAGSAPRQPSCGPRAGLTCSFIFSSWGRAGISFSRAVAGWHCGCPGCLAHQVLLGSLFSWEKPPLLTLLQLAQGKALCLLAYLQKGSSNLFQGTLWDTAALAWSPGGLTPPPWVFPPIRSGCSIYPSGLTRGQRFTPSAQWNESTALSGALLCPARPGTSHLLPKPTLPGCHTQHSPLWKSHGLTCSPLL